MPNPVELSRKFYSSDLDLVDIVGSKENVVNTAYLITLLEYANRSSFARGMVYALGLEDEFDIIQDGINRRVKALYDVPYSENYASYKEWSEAMARHSDAIVVETKDYVSRYAMYKSLLK